MKKVIIAIGILVIIVAGFFVLSSPSVSEEVPAESSVEAPPEFNFAAIESDVASGGQFLDVRTLEEYTEGHIKGAELFPLTDIQTGQYPEVDKDTKIYLYCRSGNRSDQAKTLLESAGYTDIVDLGAYQDVVSLGGTLVR